MRRFLHSLTSDIRQAARTLHRSPGLVLVSVLSIGLGLGVNLALFSAIRAVLFYEPSVADPDRVVGVEPGNSNQFSFLNYLDLQNSGAFESVAGYRLVRLNLSDGGRAELISGAVVTANFFEALGITAATGRVFGAAEAQAERQPRLAVLGHGFWRGRFAGSVRIVGQTVTINGERFDVLGVLPDGYRPVTALIEPSVYVPVSALVLPTMDDRSNGNALDVLGRLRRGSTPEQAQTLVTALGRQLEATYPQVNQGMGNPARVGALAGRELAGETEPVVMSVLLFALFALVLLSACANVAGLLMAKAVHRRREIAVRAALGARRAGLARMLLAESFLLALAGTLTGGLLAVWLMRVLRTFTLPQMGTLNLWLQADASLAVYAVALVVTTGLLCGLVPAWRTSRTNVVADIRTGDGPNTTGRLRLRHAFVVGQVAVSLTFLVLASLLLRSLARLTTLDPGFDLDRGVVAMVHVDAGRYAADGGLPLGERLVGRLEALPGIESASFANIVALGADASAARFQVEGADGTTPGARTFLNSVGQRYFSTLGIPLLRGRDFDDRDRAGSALVAIVSEAFAKAYFPGQDALGRRVRRAGSDAYSEIVGIVADSKYRSASEAAAPLFYAAYAQQPRVSTQVRPVVVHVRTATPSAIVGDVRRAIEEIAPAFAVDVLTLREATGGEARLRQFGTQLLAAVGVVALLLAAIGLYGLMAFVVSSRTAEIGTRMALGAASGRILRAFLAQGFRLAAIGIAIGAAASLMIARAMLGALAGLSPADPVAFGAAIAVLVTVGLAATFVPALHAASLSPIDALRVE